MKLRIEKEHIRQFNSLLIGITSLEFWINSFFVDVLVQQTDSDKILGKIGNSDFENIEIQNFSNSNLIEIGKRYRFKITKFKKISPIVGLLSIITNRDKLICNAVLVEIVTDELISSSKWLVRRLLICILTIIFGVLIVKASVQTTKEEEKILKFESDKSAKLINQNQQNRARKIELDISRRGNELVELVRKTNEIKLPIANVRTQWTDSGFIVFNYSLVAEDEIDYLPLNLRMKLFKKICDKWFEIKTQYNETIYLVKKYKVRSDSINGKIKFSHEEFVKIGSCKDGGIVEIL